MLVFYSREPENAQQIKLFCEQKGIQLLTKSLITFEKQAFSLDKKPSDVIFFTSPRSFDFFTAQEKISATQEIACIGAGTKNHVESKGLAVSFYGIDSSHPIKVAETFKSWLGSKTVLFPVSNISNRTVQSVLSKNQCTEVVVYNTVPRNFKMSAHPDILIFSSPSNAAAYLKQNSIHPNQKVACFGTTTQQFLIAKNIESTILTSPDENGVLNLLRTIEA